MNEKNYYKVLPGAWLLLILLIQGCKEYLPISGLGSVNRLPVELQKISYELNNNVSSTIRQYQQRGNELFFTTDQDASHNIFRIDLDSSRASSFIRITVESFPFEMNLDEFNFYIDATKQTNDIWIFDISRKTFHVLENSQFKRSLKLLENDMGCNFRNNERKIALWEWKGEKYFFSTCFLSPESSDFYQLATNVSRLTNTEDGRLQTEQFVPYPEDHHDKVISINALLDMQVSSLKGSLYFNFPASPSVVVYNDLSSVPSGILKVNSSAFGKYEDLPPNKSGDYIEEMIHHYSQGYYNNLHIWKKEEILLRMASYLSDGYLTSSYSKKEERIQALTDAFRYTIILYNLKDQQVIGEYRLAEENLFPQISFIHKDHLYINQISMAFEDESKLIFRTISLTELLKSIKFQDSGE